MFSLTSSPIPAFALATATLLTACGGGGGKQAPKIDLIPVRSGQDFQYVDDQGKIIINPQFSAASLFRDGLALVRTSGNSPKWGYIDRKGSYVINANYKEATVFEDGLAFVVSENAAPVAIDKSGAEQFSLQMAEAVRAFHEGMAAFAMQGDEGPRWGFVNKKGETVVNPQFAAARDFVGGLAAVANTSGKWGYIDPKGNFVINPQFDGALDFTDGQAAVSNGNKMGVIDKQGKYVINPQFSGILPDGGSYLVNQDGRYGWCDKEGKFTINPQFSSARPFNGNSVAPVQSGNQWGYIDRSGKFTINPQFDNAFPFNGSLAMVVSSGKVGLVDSKGKYVVNPQFDGVANDMTTALLQGGSAHSAVNSDYFNVGAVSAAIELTAPKNIQAGMSFGQVLAAYNMNGNSLNRYQNQHQIATERLNNEASYVLYAIGQPFSRQQYGWNWNMVFDANKRPDGYKYVISLTGKGATKAEQVAQALEQKLVGYTKDEGSGTWNGPQGQVAIRARGNQVEAVVVPMGEASADEADIEFEN